MRDTILLNEFAVVRDTDEIITDRQLPTIKEFEELTLFIKLMAPAFMEKYDAVALINHIRDVDRKAKEGTISNPEMNKQISEIIYKYQHVVLDQSSSESMY